MTCILLLVTNCFFSNVKCLKHLKASGPGVRDAAVVNQLIDNKDGLINYAPGLVLFFSQFVSFQVYHLGNRTQEKKEEEKKRKEKYY